MSDALSALLARLEAAKPKPIAVEVPGIGLMHVLPLTVADVDQVRPPAPEGEPESRGVVRGLLRIICDSDGNRFPETPELVALLMAQKWETLRPLQDAATGAADAGNA